MAIVSPKPSYVNLKSYLIIFQSSIFVSDENHVYDTLGCNESVVKLWKLSTLKMCYSLCLKNQYCFRNWYCKVLSHINTVGSSSYNGNMFVNCCILAIENIKISNYSAEHHGCNSMVKYEIELETKTSHNKATMHTRYSIGHFCTHKSFKG